jgi:hypothetical protein
VVFFFVCWFILNLFLFFVCIRDHLSQETKKFRLSDFIIPSKKDVEPEELKNVAVEKRLCHAITAGYFMNSAMQCTSDSVYKCLSLPSLSSNASSRDIQLVYISQQSAFHYISSPEYVLYQELVFQNKLFMKNVSYVSKKRLFAFINEFKPVSALQLNGVISQPSSSSTEPSQARKRDRQGDLDLSSDKRSKSNIPEVISPAQNEKTLSAVEQAKLRYLARKKG